MKKKYEKYSISMGGFFKNLKVDRLKDTVMSKRNQVKGRRKTGVGGKKTKLT